MEWIALGIGFANHDTLGAGHKSGQLKTLESASPGLQS